MFLLISGPSISSKVSQFSFWAPQSQISESGEWYHWADVIPSYLAGPTGEQKLAASSRPNTADLLRSMFDDEAEEDDQEGTKSLQRIIIIS